MSAIYVFKRPRYALRQLAQCTALTRFVARETGGPGVRFRAA